MIGMQIIGIPIIGIRMIDPVFYKMTIEMRMLHGTLGKIARDEIERRLAALDAGVSAVQFFLMQMLSREEQTMTDLIDENDIMLKSLHSLGYDKATQLIDLSRELVKNLPNGEEILAEMMSKTDSYGAHCKHLSNNKSEYPPR
jgi:hypothetical protein